ncbi:flavin-containing monooxygenase [Hymenobacter fodinae]|uniref:FAD-dependent oxidoreductase n=1 Tax=Hymenobacter fodinae TaxID=2510796 RepID=A0A4Z0PDF6_9BACT|nr:NAD(P)/FAD-dependent oxidoreductase [Hymenobacter fodinae]TGE09760.1 FAD-dependent oxidoreductase [Hymenobacter fodinae]
MTSLGKVLDAVVIGAGQAGLAAAYYLQQRQASYVVLDERPAVGHVWATRYASLRLFSPAWASGLPGLPWPGKRLRYPTKDEAADYLRQYAEHFHLAIETDQRVTNVQPTTTGEFEVHTAAGNCYHTRRVIVCTGPYSTPSIPPFATNLPPTVRQLHSSGYNEPSQVPGNPVAVVGSGNSALQIAADLATHGHTVYVAFDEKTPAMPNNTAMWVGLLSTGLLEAPTQSWLGRFMRRQPEPVVRADLRRLQRMPTVQFIGRAMAATAEGGLVGRGITTPTLAAVVWATGYRPNYSWLHLPAALSPTGEPRHSKGISPVPGLAFLGLDWLSSRRSALMGGAGADACYVVQQLLEST